MSEDQKKELQKQLWNIANDLRGNMDASQFRDYILGFIFYKYLSEKIELYADDLLKADGIKYTDIDESTNSGEEYVVAIQEHAVENLGYFLRPKDLFHHVALKGSTNPEDLIEILERILNNIENSTMGTDSEEDFEQLFSELDLNQSKLGKTVVDRGKLISKVLLHLDKIDFRLEDSKVDILGDAYEYLISQFAAGAGKKAGEFYTPQEVSEILAQIVTNGKKKLKSVYDPTCGSGSLLLRVARQVEEVSNYYGQELNNTTYNLARMNMILHDVRFDRFNIKQEDTLEHPQHAEMRFEAVVANPPFSAKWSANPLHLQDDRFSQYGKLAPKSKADYAFIQHMIYQLDENGTMAVVMPHGVLFRGAAEGHIREYLIKEKNYLDAVIGLPSNLFFGTSIPACILIFKKCRENPEDVLFIDASQHFVKGKNQNKLRPEDISKILQTYKDRKSEDKYSHVAKLSEIAENDYNLNIPRYVDTFEEEEPIDLKEVTAEIKKIDVNMSEIDKKIAAYCKELGIEAPF
ncbi:TPA: type I restriction-modification system subunit M [Candidatus Saccharibacteria bacterium]|nr:type I restriction-modification system subunit M [Candidatus Saccharibacteria bacterium]HIO87317.1 type I restriction-modification system subunit M [Candidatus Saccharibacteria bacterium]